MPKVHQSASQKRLRAKLVRAAVKPPNNVEIMTLREVAHWLRMHPNTIYRMVRCEQLPSFRFGRNLRFSRSQILAGSAQHYVKRPRPLGSKGTNHSQQTSMDFDAWISG